MTGMWFRSLLLLPGIFLAASIGGVVRSESEHLVRVGSWLIVSSGVLLAVSGWIGVVVGVPAEEYTTDLPHAHALEVLADSLFWIQQNLITMAYLTLATAVATPSVSMRAAGRFPTWMTLSGMATLPLILISSMFLVCTQPYSALKT